MVLDVQALRYEFEEGAKEVKERAKEGTSEGHPRALGGDKEETLPCPPSKRAPVWRAKFLSLPFSMLPVVLRSSPPS